MSKHISSIFLALGILLMIISGWYIISDVSPYASLGFFIGTFICMVGFIGSQLPSPILLLLEDIQVREVRLNVFGVKQRSGLLQILEALPNRSFEFLRHEEIIQYCLDQRAKVAIPDFAVVGFTSSEEPAAGEAVKAISVVYVEFSPEGFIIRNFGADRIHALDNHPGKLRVLVPQASF